MATPGELVRVIAAVLREDEATVTQHDRNLLIAGLRTKGGRGRSAAKVTPRDAANVLTSVLGSHRVRDGVATVRRYLQTQEHHAHWHHHHPDKLRGMGIANVWEQCGISELAALPREHTFIDVLVVLITLASEGRLLKALGDFYPLDSIRIIVTWPRTYAQISMQTSRIKGDDRKSVQANYGIEPPPPENKTKVVPPLRNRMTIKPGLDRQAGINAMPIIYIGALLAGRLDDLPEIEHADA
jgi:hypothetical protein